MNYNADNDWEQGREAFIWYFNQAVKNGLDLKLDQAATQVAGGEKKVQYFYQGLGGAIHDIQDDGFLSNSNAQKAMENLANQGGDKLPKISSFYAAISGQAQNFSFFEAAPFVLKETAGAVVKGAEDVGNAVIDTGKSLLSIGPIVIVAAALFFVWSKTKKLSA